MKRSTGKTMFFLKNPIFSDLAKWAKSGTEMCGFFWFF